VKQTFQQAIRFFQQGRTAEAQSLCEAILKTHPKDLEALQLLTAIACQTRNQKRALALIDQAIAIFPDNFSLHNDRGNVFQELKQLDAALASYAKAITIKPDYALAHYNQGNVLLELGQFDVAVASYDKALAIRPDYVEALCNRGLALQKLLRHDTALASYNQAIAIKPDFALAYNNRGNVLLKLNQFDLAVASYDQAVAIIPNYAQAYCNRGLALQQLKQYELALASFNMAVSIRPDYAQAFNNRGLVLQDLHLAKAAIASYDRAIALKPDHVEAHGNRGNALAQLKQYQAAIASYDKALAFASEQEYDLYFGLRLHLKSKLCDWQDIEEQLAELIQRINHGKKSAIPFAFLGLSDSLPLQHKVAEIWANDQHLANMSLGTISKYPRHQKIRVGYYSADFRNHPLSYLLAGMFEQHDRDTFEFIAFSFGPDTNDEMRQRVSTAFDQFIDVRNKTEKEIAQLSRDLQIDIAVDLMGFTKFSQVGIFAYRAAPIQASYMGYPGTLATDFIDYIIADKIVLPPENQLHYSEKVAYLPDSYFCNDDKRQIVDKTFTRKELGLPKSGFVFCCFNNNTKITPTTFAGWMRILKKAPGSVLWLHADSPIAANNLRQEAARREVDAQRLVFADHFPLPEHLARQRAADLFLDTRPYNAHTTACDALWAGLPVLTCTGESMASRVAASILSAIGAPELIVNTQEEYESMAVELATNPKRLEEIKQNLTLNRLSTPLFDTTLFTRNIENAYRQMYERYQADLPPDHFGL